MDDAVGTRARNMPLQILEERKDLLQEQLEEKLTTDIDTISTEETRSFYSETRNAYRELKLKTVELVIALLKAGSKNEANNQQVLMSKTKTMYTNLMSTLKQRLDTMGDNPSDFESTIASNRTINSAGDADRVQRYVNGLPTPSEIGDRDLEAEIVSVRGDVSGEVIATSTPKVSPKKVGATEAVRPGIQSQNMENRDTPAQQAAEATVGGCTPNHQKISSHPEQLNWTDLKITKCVPFKTIERDGYPKVTIGQAGNTLDFLLKRDLKQRKMIFHGDPLAFTNWVRSILYDLHGLPTYAMDVITLLESQTQGEPNDRIQQRLKAASFDPQMMLASIWKELFFSYGSPEVISNAIEIQMESLAPLKTGSLKEITQLLDHLHLVRTNDAELHFSSLAEKRRLYTKLPTHHQRRWTSILAKRESHPSFEEFTQFVEDLRHELRIEEQLQATSRRAGASRGRVLVTQDSSKVSPGKVSLCPVHKNENHYLTVCNLFRDMNYVDRLRVVSSNRLCFKCTGSHFKSNCHVNVKCSICQGPHHTLMHDPEFQSRRRAAREGTSPRNSAGVSRYANNLCTAVCGEPEERSCSKTLLCEVRLNRQSRKVRCYVILDEQSSLSFISDKLRILLKANGPVQDYSIATLNGGKYYQNCMLIKNMLIKGVGERKEFSLPPLLTNDDIPALKNEIATPEIVRRHSHIDRFSGNFNELDQDAEVMLLLGRDSGELMRTKCYGRKAPFAHQTPLGWALVGPSCPYRSSEKKVSYQSKTLKVSVTHQHFISKPCFSKAQTKISLPLTDEVFGTQPDDDIPDMSQDNKRWCKVVAEGITTNSKGSLVIPLPFKSPEVRLPDNRSAVYQRTANSLMRLQKDPVRLEGCLETMGKYLEAGHVEMIPPNEVSTKDLERVWFVPVFPVINPKKPGKVRMVFDSSASFENVSLNARLLPGPDQNNRLKSVLTRFRKKPLAVVGDIEAMYHQFYLPEEDCDLLRFFWFDKNDPTLSLKQFRAKVHIFGNAPSPAIANYGLRFTTNQPEADQWPESKSFILHNFYVDDGLLSTDTVEEAINVMTGARKILSRFNIRLHKMASNSKEILHAFPESELKQVETVSLNDVDIHHTLGLVWDTKRDTLTFKVDLPERPFTRRGVLSVVNSLFDPLGLVGPLVIKGKILQRQLLTLDPGGSSTLDWDQPLPSEQLQSWKDWRSSLHEVSKVKVDRSFYPLSFPPLASQELHVFSDASEAAIGFAIYIRSTNTENDVHVSLVTASSKIAPKGATSIPRLELCAATDAAISAKIIEGELQSKVDLIRFYSDSSAVLGYITNGGKTFTKYVTRRVEKILNVSEPQDWSYVDTKSNPADFTTRPCTVPVLINSSFYKGPDFLWQPVLEAPLKSPNLKVSALPELVHRTLVTTTADDGRPGQPFLSSVYKLSKYNRMKGVIKVLLRCRRLIDKTRQKLGISLSPRRFDATESEVIIILVKNAQAHAFPSLGYNHKFCVPSISSLSPFLDDDGVLRVGGRLRLSVYPFSVTHPMLLPNNHGLASAIVDHYHKTSQHQGRAVTAAAIRAAGFHVMSSRSAIDKHIGGCLFCRRLRGKPLQQRMADLPSDRLAESAPFTYCGIDTFGPLQFTDGATTRTSSSTKKMWGLLATCLVSRAVHIEVLHGLDTSSFRNALRRFWAVRGVSKMIRSDNATNFVAAEKQLRSNIDHKTLSEEAEARGIRWIFNPPSASHFGGVWETKIASVRRILNSVMLQVGNRPLNRDELNTFLQECACIINQTPLWPISVHPDDPLPLTPAALLQQRLEPHVADLETFTQHDLLAYGQRRWRRVQVMAETFWQHWRKYHLHHLQAKTKWIKEKRNLKPGDLVLLLDKNSPRNEWPMAVVQTVKLSTDGLVRSAHVRSASKKTIHRPITSMILLDVSNETAEKLQR